MYVFMYVYVCIYIYIYIHIGQLQGGHCKLFCLFYECLFFVRDLLGTPVNLLVSSPKCQGVPFSTICRKCITFAVGPLVSTPLPPSPL